MKTIAVRLHGADDLRLDRFELPDITDDEILADVTSNGICMSSYKATKLGAKHKRVPDDVATNPIMMGHEFCGTILQVGKNWQHKFKVGDKYGIQPQLNYPGREHIAPGYSFPYTGGQAAKIIIPKEVLEMDCLLPYDGEAFFYASLAESFSCVIGAFNTNYHFKTGTYEHINGIVEGGKMALLAGAGPMGIAAIDYAIHGDQKPGLLIVTDIDQSRLDRVASVLSPEDARANGVDLRYVNTTGFSDPVADLRALSGGAGFDDVFVFAPVPPLISQASAILGFNGCLNFFAGPSAADFMAPINFYDVHYMGHHVVGSSGGNTDDMREALRLMGLDRINPATMVTHIGGLDSAPATIQNLPNVPGGRKLIYTQLSLPLTAINDFAKVGESDPLFAALAEIVARHNMLWCLEAETYLVANGKRLLDN
ncbi:MAG: zinc-binding dehydrogenase [Verrucomicrobia bacterium]|nr:zinc-binding dehydrogenase [Verrucomicrobiota bacterium]